jgi:4-amino-4-deoxy-L-arabinose transferase-like glycosyltransferase
MARWLKPGGAATGFGLGLSTFLGVALCASLVGALLAPLFDVDEGAFSEATREMLESADFGFTFLNGQPRFDKPILIYWLQAASFAAFGLHELAARLPSILAGLSGALVASFFAARWTANPGNALLALVLFSSSLGPLVMRHAATADALLHLFLLLSVLSLIESMRLEAHLPRLGLRLAWAFSALAVLTKGLIGLMVPAVTVLGVCVLRRGLAPLRHAFSDPIAAGLWLGLCLPWYLYAYLRFDSSFIAGLFGKHHLERSLHPLEGHSGSLAYTPLMMLVLALPFTPWILAGAWRTLRGAPRRVETQALAAWCASLLIVFSLVATKLPHYAMYALLPLLMLAALGDGPRRTELMLGLVLGLAIVLPGLFIDPILQALAQQRPEGDYYRDLLAVRAQSWASPSGADSRVSEASAEGLPASLAFSGWLALGVCLASFWALASPGGSGPQIRFRPGGLAPLLGLGAAMHLSLCLSVLPLLGVALQGPTREVARASAAQSAVTYRFRAPSVAFYRERITEDRLPEPGEQVILRSRDIAALEQGAGPAAVFRPVHRAGPVLLLRREPDLSP